jgi:long-chain acyl-CoA synthetase
VQDVRNVADLVRRAAAGEGAARPALRWHDRVLTWGDLDAQADAVAAALRGLMTPTGDAVAPRVAIALPNVPEFAAAYFGALRAGLVVVPVNPGYTARELQYVLTDTGAEIIVGTPAVLEAVAGVEAPALRYAYTLGAATGGAPPFADLTVRPFGELLATPAAPAEPAGGGEDLAVLLYTSGTSGMPKGAMLSHRALLANHAQLAAIQPPPLGPDDVVLLTLPLFHSYGLNTGLGAIAYHGASGVLVERFDPADTLALIRRLGVTVVVGVPPMYVAWSLMGDQLKAGFASVRVAVSGAAPLDVATARRFAEVVGRPVYEGYGLTETSPVLTSTLGQKEPKPGSIGRPLPDVEIKLVDANGNVVGAVDDDGIDDDDFEFELEYDSPGSPGTDPGVIVMRGPNVFSGYWPDGQGGPDADGWWSTADIGYADADGDLFLVDRVGELIIVSGFNVYPHEVELVLVGHPEVIEAAAVGVNHPYTQQTVKAYVVRRPDSAVTAEDLIAYCERNLARFKCPTAVEFLPSLPRSATGKVRKGELGG